MKLSQEELEIYINEIRSGNVNLDEIDKQILIDNSEICMEAVKKSGYVLRYVPEEIKIANVEICIAAVREHWGALGYVPKGLKIEDVEMAKEAVKTNGYFLEYVPKEVQIANPEICMEAVRRDSLALQYVPEELKIEDVEMAKVAVEINYRFLKYVSEEIQIANPEICMKAVEKNGEALEYVSKGVQIANPETCIEAVRRNGYDVFKYVSGNMKIKNVSMAKYAVICDYRFLSYVPREVQISNPEICMEAVEKNGKALEYVSKEVQIANPEICIEAVRKNGYALQYVPKEAQMSNPKICIEAVKNCGYNAFRYISEEMEIENVDMAIEAFKTDDKFFRYISKKMKIEDVDKAIEAVKIDEYFLRYVPQEVKIANPEICVETVKEHGYALEYVPEKLKIEDVEMAKEAVKIDYRFLEHIPEKIQKSNPEICIEAVKSCGYNAFEYVSEELKIEDVEVATEAVEISGYFLKYVSEEIQIANPEICIKAAKKNGVALEYVPEELKIEDVEMATEAVKINWEFLKYVPKEVQIANPEICMEAVWEESYALQYVPEKVQMKYSNICEEAIESDAKCLQHVSEKVQMRYPNICEKAIEYDAECLQYVPENVQMKYPNICEKAIDIWALTLQYVPEEVQMNNQQICIKALDWNINAYEYVKIKDSKEIQEYMFEDPERMVRIKEKAHFDISDNYRDYAMDIFYHNMVKSIGLDETEKLVEIPDFTDEEIEKYNLDYNEKFNEVYDTKYKVKSDEGAALELFRNLNLGEYKQKGKDVSFLVYKNINLGLEENNLNSYEYIRKCISDANVHVSEEFERKLNEKLKIISGNLADERLESKRQEIDNELSQILSQNGHLTQKKAIMAIIENGIKKELVDGYGKVEKDDVIKRIEEELSRKKENGQNYYSAHILSQRENILNMTEKYVDKIDNKDLCDILKQTKDKTGNGWIRKILNVPRNLSKEELENLQKNLGYELSVDKEAILKDGVNKDEAYKILTEAEIPSILTYEKAELMFDGIHEPFSENFKKFYVEHKQEILEDPEIYTKFSSMHNSFDSIIRQPELIAQFENGNVTPKDIIRIMSEQKYENIREGNEKFAEVASRANLPEEYFEQAQDVFETTRKRKETNIPQIFTTSDNKKYRGRMLRADDPLNHFVGNITDCCQRYGGVGEGSMVHASTSKNGGIFIVEEIDKNGQVIRPVAQSWTWRNKDRLCFDNIEVVKNRDVSEEEKNDILQVYQKSAEKFIENDIKKFEQISQEKGIKIEGHVLKEVTVGTGYNPLIVDTKEDKEYTNIVPPPDDVPDNAWVDSQDEVVLFKKISAEQLKHIQEIDKNNKKAKSVENVDIGYKNRREVRDYDCRKLSTEDVEKIKRIENSVYRDDQKILQYCENAYDLSNAYDIDIDKAQISMSEDGDWYMVYEENDSELHISDLAMVGGANSQNKEKTENENSRIATLEIAEKVYSKMLDMAKKNKKVRYAATRDTSYLNTKKMKEKGLIEVEEDEQDYFEDTDIEMNNIVAIPNEEKLEKELERIRKELGKLTDRDIIKSSKKGKDENGRQAKEDPECI